MTDGEGRLAREGEMAPGLVSARGTAEVQRGGLPLTRATGQTLPNPKLQTPKRLEPRSESYRASPGLRHPSAIIMRQRSPIAQYAKANQARAAAAFRQ